MRSRILNPHKTSLLRGSALVLLSLGAAYLLSGFPNDRTNPFLVLPAGIALIGGADTLRCMRCPQWDLFHVGVLFCLYMDLLSICLILFLLLDPYMLWLTGGH
ncbi:permease [Edaphobacter paludis]|uniref:Permease n=1 Tax=Edaphobacter paludis TaxID=3035702 RepID=A0AAU7D355_9BACT